MPTESYTWIQPIFFGSPLLLCPPPTIVLFPQLSVRRNTADCTTKPVELGVNHRLTTMLCVFSHSCCLTVTARGAGKSLLTLKMISLLLLLVALKMMMVS